MSIDDDFLQQLRATFKVEANEHLQVISTGLLELEKTPDADAQSAIVETVFRAAHSLKGAARAVDFTQIESLCQSLEDVFASWKGRKSAPTPATLDALHRALDAINSTLAGDAERSTGGVGRDPGSVNEPLPRSGSSAAPPLQAYREPAVRGAVAEPAAIPIAPPARPDPAPVHRSDAEETVRLPVSKLEAQLLESEEMLTAKLMAGERVTELRGLTDRVAMWRKVWALAEPDVRHLRQWCTQEPDRGGPPVELARLLDFFDSSFNTLKSLEGNAVQLARAADRDRQAVGKLVDDLLNDSKSLLLLPFGTIWTAFPRLVRDLCRDQGKDVDLVMHGEDIQIDKRMLEEIKDPLVHLLRNSIDHGIEVPAERVRRGKPARAKIALELSQINGNKVQLLFSDDGAGIDVEKVKAAAVRSEVISAEEADRLDDEQAQALIFRSEVSTSPMITQLSGRGLGLAIVREKVEKLGGEVSVESRPGQGTTFRLVIPAVRATFRGILVNAAGRVLVVPTAQVECVTRIDHDDVITVEGRESISLAGRALPLVQLKDVLELPAAERDAQVREAGQALVLGTGDQRIAFAVDAVLDEQEVLVKPLRKPLSRVRNVAAATVLGSGLVVPVLNVADLLKSARRMAVNRAAPIGAAPAAQGEARSVLVAEDSITSRMLIKNILESAGYRVKTAVDGAEAFATLRTEDFDLLVSDVEMPRLNGFDLTARIRADRKLKDLPVVLVTALETREDRERGIDVGANAYLIKSSFDQSNLLEAVRRLI